MAICGRAPGITTHLKQQINMDPLHIRRQTQRLTLMYKITNNYIDIDPYTYLHSTNYQRTRNTHNQTYQTYYANTDSYKYSYFPRTIRDWNRLPQSILNSNTIDSLLHKTNTHALVTTTRHTKHSMLTRIHTSTHTFHAP